MLTLMKSDAECGIFSLVAKRGKAVASHLGLGPGLALGSTLVPGQVATMNPRRRSVDGLGSQGTRFQLHKWTTPDQVGACRDNKPHNAPAPSPYAAKMGRALTSAVRPRCELRVQMNLRPRPEPR